MATATDRMGTAPMPSLILKNALPLMLSLLINNFYVLVDSIFVSRISEEALTAMSIATPVQALIAALGLGIAMGFNAAFSKALGERDRVAVREISSAAMFLGVVCWLLLGTVYLCVAEPYFAWQSGGNETIAAYGKQYLGIIMLGSLGCMGQWVFDRMVIASGRSVGFLFTLSAASVTNLILDPILIFGLDLGIRGAAIATVCGQFAGAICGFCYNRFRNREIELRFTLRPQWGRIAQILRVGIPTTVMQMLVSFMGIFTNTILGGFSSTAVAVNGICLKLQPFVTTATGGLNTGLVPILAYNYGAKKPERIHAALRWTLIDGFAIMAVVLVLLELLASPLLRLFGASEQLMSLGLPAIRILAVSYFASTFGVTMNVVFQAFGKGVYSMCLTVARQVVLLLPLLLIASWLGRLPLVWVSYIVVEVLALPIGLCLWRRIKREVVVNI